MNFAGPTTYEGLSYDSVGGFIKSIGETIYHLTVIDVVQPLFNWGLRVDNAVTAIQANQSGAVMSFDQATGAVTASPTSAEGGFLIYPNKPNNNALRTVYKK